MPSRLQRFQHTGRCHFITFSCYRHKDLFTEEASRRVFEEALERVRRTYRVRIYGYVVMLDHVHLLIGEPEEQILADALKSLKQGVARRLIGDAPHFWQKRYYDFNVRFGAKFVEKLRYIHRNPVKRGLCNRPEDWKWSSFRHYAMGVKAPVEIASRWTWRSPHSSQNQA